MKKFIILILTLALCLSIGVLSALAPAQDFSPSTALIELDISNHPDWARVVIKTEQYIEYLSYELSNPPRIVFDPVEPLLCNLKETLLVKEGLVTSVRIVKHAKEITEREGFYLLDFLVIELKNPTAHSTAQRVNVVTLVIGRPPEAPPVTLLEEKKVERKPPLVKPPAVEKKPPTVKVELLAEEEKAPVKREVKALMKEAEPPAAEIKVPVEKKQPLKREVEPPLEAGALEPVPALEAKPTEALLALEVKPPEFIETKPISPPEDTSGEPTIFLAGPPPRSLLLEEALTKVARPGLEEPRPPRLRAKEAKEPGLAKKVKVEKIEIEEAEAEGPFEVKEAKVKEIPKLLPHEVRPEAKVERPPGRTFRELRDRLLARAEAEVRVREIPEKGPLSFEECLAIAAYNYMPLQVADEEIRLAEMKVREAKRALYPSAKAKTSFIDGEVHGVDFREREYGVELEQPIYYAGRLRYTLRQAEVNREVAFEKYDKAQGELIAKITEKFYELAAAQVNLEDQKKLRRDARMVSSLAKRRFDVELSTNLEFLNVKSQCSKIEYQIAVAHKEVEMAKIKLLQAMGIDPPQDIQIDFSLGYKELDIDLDECLWLAHENRPELIMHELLLESSELEETIAKSKGGFKIDLTGFYGQYGGAWKTEDLTLSEDWYFGVKAAKPWGSHTGNYSYTQSDVAPKFGEVDRKATASHNLEFGVMDNLAVLSEKQTAFIGLLKAENELLEMEKSVNLEVREAYDSYEKSIMQIQNTLERIRFRQEEVKILEAEAALNEALLSQVLEAKVRLADEMSLHNQAIASYKTAIANLNKSIGITGYFY